MTVDLDEVEALAAHDPSDMLGAIAALPTNCAESYRAGGSAWGGVGLHDIASIVFCGMGGSAVAGDLLRSVYRDELHVPLEVNRAPTLPAFAREDALVITCSYSGETAETMQAFDEAVRRGCRMLTVTSGGTIGRRSAERGIPVVAVPAGSPPRAALGHIAFGTLGFLEAAGTLSGTRVDVDGTVAELAELVQEMALAVPAARNDAKRLARAIHGRLPIVWGADGIGSVAAMRWKTQLNENGKVPAWCSSMSELDHNEVVGWSDGQGEGCVVIALRHAGEPDELASRFELSERIVRAAGAGFEAVTARGRSPLSRLMTLILVGDLTSAYVGILRGVDPTPVVAIDRLKAALAGGR